MTLCYCEGSRGIGNSRLPTVSIIFLWSIAAPSPLDDAFAEVLVSALESHYQYSYVKILESIYILEMKIIIEVDNYTLMTVLIIWVAISI